MILQLTSGTIDTEGETLGLYVGLNTGALSISLLELVQGEYEIDTTRKDLGSLKTINANDITADVHLLSC